MERMEIFNSFWQMSWNQKKICVTSLIETISRKRIYAVDSRRSVTKIYFLKTNTMRLQVCQKMFLSTLGITERMARDWVNSANLNGTHIGPENNTTLKTQERKIRKNGKQYEQRLEFLNKWLEEVPKLESHYRRQYTNRLYLQSDFKSYKHVYDVYCDECKLHTENGILPVSFPNFRDILEKNKVSLFKPRNDRCDICTSYEAYNLSKDQYDLHREEIKNMREEKLNDIENAKSEHILLLCMDMQAVKLIPQSNTNASYYKMKLQVHNFTIYDITSHESDNFVWDESEGNLVASTFATCIIKYIKNVIVRSPIIDHIIIYSDGCFYQNRNEILSNALLSTCVEANITIEHKYLVVGHTQMECDSTHSIIQRKINNKQINLPSQLVDLIKTSRKNPAPLKVHHLDHKYFLDYDSIPKRYSSIRPGKKTGDPTVNKLRALAYDPSGIIYFKINIKDDYQILPQRIAQKFHVVHPPQMYSERIQISKKKFQHLQELKKLLPKDCHYFYDHIPYEN